MNQAERREYLIRELLREQPWYRDQQIPAGADEKKTLLRSLFNVRPPLPAGEEFLRIQDNYLREEIRARGITDIADLTPVKDNLYLWRGDITTLKAGAIVNAANDRLLGCFVPCHACIDNAIHTFAGIQLRLACDELMREQGRPEETGRAKITPAFNLRSDYVLHTVGPIIGRTRAVLEGRDESVRPPICRRQIAKDTSPIITDRPTQRDCELLASCYRSCLELAEQNGIDSVAFCCISTGEFRFPNEKAAEIAIQTVTEFIAERHSKVKVIFNVFKETDHDIYRRLLTAD